MMQVWSAASGGLSPSGDVQSNYDGAGAKKEVNFFLLGQCKIGKAIFESA